MAAQSIPIQDELGPVSQRGFQRRAFELFASAPPVAALLSACSERGEETGTGRWLVHDHDEEYEAISRFRAIRNMIPPRGNSLFVDLEDHVKTRICAVPGMHCGHCQAAVTEELKHVQGVESVQVDLDSKLVTVNGHGLDDKAMRAAIGEAGYEVAA